jgi:SAM-dependent methyltransferase
MNSNVDALQRAISQWADFNRQQITGNDAAYLTRVYQDGLTKYRDRLSAIAFSGLGHVLDAGCGFGQWTLALSELNESVSACDISTARISALQKLSLAIERNNIEAKVSTFKPLRYPEAHFDAVFCYSVLPCVAWHEALREIHRVTKPGGTVYVNANGVGWYVHLWLNSPNQSEGYDPRKFAADTFVQTVEYERTGKFEGGNLIIEKDNLVSFLSGLGFVQIITSGEGMLELGSNKSCPTPFFKSEYYGLPGVYEVLARKGVSSEADV